MLWLAVLALPDGGQVESSLVAVQTASTGLAARAYRLRLADGSVTDFSTLASIVRHLVDHYDPDDLSRAASRHEALTAGLAAAARVNLAFENLDRSQLDQLSRAHTPGTVRERDSEFG